VRQATASLTRCRRALRRARRGARVEARADSRARELRGRSGRDAAGMTALPRVLDVSLALSTRPSFTRRREGGSPPGSDREDAGRPRPGTVSTEAKAEAAKRAGADVVIRYTEEDFEVVARRGRTGAASTWSTIPWGRRRSTRAFAPCGLGASGALRPVQRTGAAVRSGELAKRGSFFLTRPTLAHYNLDRAELLDRASDVLSWMERGELEVRSIGCFLWRRRRSPSPSRAGRLAGSWFFRS
jgi:hypothetical protein